MNDTSRALVQPADVGWRVRPAFGQVPDGVLSTAFAIAARR